MIRLGVLAIALLLPPPGTGAPQRVSLTVANAPWSMRLPADTFEMTQERIKPDGSAAYFLLTKGVGGLTVSVFIEPIDQCTSAVACRDWAWEGERSRLKDIQSVAKTQMGDAAVVEYLLPRSGDVKVDQENMHAYYVKEGFWIDVHISKIAYQKADRDRFVALIRGIDFAPKAPGEARAPASPGTGAGRTATLPASREAMEWMRQGSQLYREHEFEKAIVPYGKALELERRQRTLDEALWRVLIDNLGMSYGITGDLEHAKKTFEFGLSQDASYPMFYYNLACTYGEMNDLAKTLSNLRLAFQYRANMIPGEVFPDPAKDDSFQRFMRDDRFLTALAEMKKLGK